MRALIQRVNHACVSIDGNMKSEIQHGLLVLIGITDDDTDEDIEWLTHKIVYLRIFDDENHQMNLSLPEVKGDLLLVSQFTLYADTKKGNRPSYIQAAKPEIAIPLYEKCIDAFEHKLNKKVQTGMFGADMQIALVNDGPVTIWIDTKNR